MFDRLKGMEWCNLNFNHATVFESFDLARRPFAFQDSFRPGAGTSITLR